MANGTKSVNESPGHSCLIGADGVRCILNAIGYQSLGVSLIILAEAPSSVQANTALERHSNKISQSAQRKSPRDVT